MKFIKIFLFLGVLLNAGSIYAVTATTTDNSAKESKDEIALLDGRWEGELTGDYYEGTVKKDQPHIPFALEISKKGIKFFNMGKDEKWEALKPSFVNAFGFQSRRNTIRGEFFNSGTDEDGVWVESQTMYITYEENDWLLIYWMRAVNNTGVDKGKAGTKWMHLSVGRLKK